MGFIAAATVAGAAISAYGAKKQGDAAAKGSKAQLKQEKEESERKFQRDAYLGELARKWGLEDRRYKEDAVGGFRQFAPASAQAEQPKLTTTEGLADFDPNKIGQGSRFAGTGATAPRKTMLGMAPGGGGMGGQMDR